MINKYKLIKTTEKDRETTKVAIPTQNFGYDELDGLTFSIPHGVEIGRSAYFFAADNKFNISTSTVESTEHEGNELVVVTKNTVYFFEEVTQ